MIRCDLEDMSKYGSLFTGPTETTKKGRYHGSMFWDVPGYGKKQWVVATKIVTDEDVSGLSEEQIISRCIEYLNTPPPRRKYQKKKSKPKYGDLKLYSAKVQRGENQVSISALLIVSDRKNKNFWGTGIDGK